MIQTKDELEQHYSQGEDPWEYRTNKDDIHRRNLIRALALQHSGDFWFDRALDIGAGEGWISSILPASTIHGFELSDIAASRFPDKVERKLSGKYDLVTACGVLYAHYDVQLFFSLMRQYASKIVMTCNIKEWQVPIPDVGKILFEATFPYRQYTQILRVYDVSLPQDR